MVGSVVPAPQKTPISVLNELNSKNKLDISGHCVDIEDPLGPPTSVESVRCSPIFRYEYLCGPYIARGEGTAKKRAQHNAAEKMIDILKKSPEFSSVFSDNITLSSPSEIKVDKDAVGPLMDFNGEYQLPTPDYVTVREEGPAHDKRFTSRCSIPSYAVEATDRQKKQAKQQVAKMMHTILKNTIEPRVNREIDGRAIVDDEAHDFEETVKKFPHCKTIFNTKFQLKDLSSPLMSDFSRYQNYHCKVKEALDEFTPLEIESPEEALDSILHKIEINYSLIPVASKKKHLLVLNIQFAPDLSISEMGSSYLDAARRAARKALDHIRILCSPLSQEIEETPEAELQPPRDIENGVSLESSK